MFGQTLPSQVSNELKPLHPSFKFFRKAINRSICRECFPITRQPFTSAPNYTTFTPCNDQQNKLTVAHLSLQLFPPAFYSLNRRIALPSIWLMN
ncbi:hypothetical protein CEXT_241581 [Caerostris extrusa]|uniref:Uncharacterized protein n=1 Tax=Caerostris extrusa TaxID=172846 RepID=A0AAV4P7U9_CAEEX|nr:hypothetical protein CEXT_241581 [Caerostris extrusa]